MARPGQRLIGDAALHTQQGTARQIVQEAGADYLLTVKANQKELRQTLAQRLPHRSTFFPSSTAAAQLGARWAGKEPECM